MDVAVDRHHCRGTKIIPFSMKNVDEVLGDLDVQIGRLTRASHWLNPISPAAYAGLTPLLLERLSTHGAGRQPPATVTALPTVSNESRRTA